MWAVITDFPLLPIRSPEKSSAPAVYGGPPRTIDANQNTTDTCELFTTLLRLPKPMALYHPLDGLAINAGFLRRVAHMPIMALQQIQQK